MTTPINTLAFTDTRPAHIFGLIVGYARSANQGAEATALQRESLEAYSMRTFGRALDRFYEDFRSSGATLDRPGLEAVMKTTETVRVMAIVVPDMDRVARRIDLMQRFERFCETADVELHTVIAGHRRPPQRLLTNDQIKRILDEDLARSMWPGMNAAEALRAFHDDEVLAMKVASTAIFHLDAEAIIAVGKARAKARRPAVT